MAINVLFEPTVSVVPIEITYNKNVTPESVADYSQQIGKYPYVYFHGLVIEYTDISYLKIYNDSFYPNIEMIFTDRSGKLFDEIYPLDGEAISIYISSRSKSLKPIRCDFTITVFNISKDKPGESEYRSYFLKGFLDFNDLIDSRGYTGTSFDVLKTLAQEGNLGFATNVDGTNDSMTWINTGWHISEFVPDITLCSYKSDDTFLWSYIDLFYMLNYIDIEEQMNEDISQQKCIVSDNQLNEGEEKTGALILTNDSDYNGTNLYIDKYKITNESYQTNWDIGYNSYIYYYNKTENTLNSYMLDTISTVGKDQNLIVQKSTPDDNQYQFLNRRNYYLGRVDQDNMHRNYLYAYQQNVNNIKFLGKIRMNIVLKKLNFSLYRYQLVEIVIYKTGQLEESKEDITANKTNKINQRLSGQWLITGINFVLDKTDGFRQEISVVKRELTATYKPITQADK